MLAPHSLSNTKKTFHFRIRHISSRHSLIVFCSTIKSLTGLSFINAFECVSNESYDLCFFFFNSLYLLIYFDCFRSAVHFFWLLRITTIDWTKRMRHANEEKWTKISLNVFFFLFFQLVLRVVFFHKEQQQ